MKWLSGGDFITKDCCGHWEYWLKNMHEYSDTAMALCCIIFPLIVLLFVVKSKVPVAYLLRWKPLSLLFCSVLYGVNHLIEAYLFYYPLYRIQGYIKFFCSVATIILLAAAISLVPKIIISMELMVKQKRQIDALNKRIRFLHERIEKCEK